MTTRPTTGITRHDTTSRYADPRTAAAPRSAPPRYRARVRTAVAAPSDLHGTIATAAAIAIAPPRTFVTDADQLDTITDPNVPTRVIDGTPCTNRAGIAYLAGWPTNVATRNVYANRDPDFPQPLPDKIGREYWYPMDRVDAYLATLAERATAKKPPAVKDGDPDDELHGEKAADALHITYATLRSYIRYAVPYWKGEKTGRPQLPRPDIEEQREHEKFGTYTYRAWYRRTLAEHQQHRPGPGTPKA